VQTKLGYRPRKTNKKHISEILRETKDKIPTNSFTKIASGYEIQLYKPNEYLNDFRHPYFLFTETVPVEDILFGSIKNGRYIQHNYIPSIIDSSNQILDGAQRHPYYYNPWKNSYNYSLTSIQKIPEARVLKGNVFCLATDGCHNGFFHFLTRLTAKLSILEEVGIDKNTFSHFIVNGPEKKYKKECLKQAGIDLNKVIYADENQLFTAELLFFVPRVRFHSLGHDYLRDIFLDKNSAKAFNNTYVSRKDAKHRYLLQEDEMLQTLSKFDFNEVTLSTLSCKEQASLFNSSKNIIGCHGAGLANIIFCQKDANLVEIYDDEFVNVNYWFYANIFGLNYFPLIGKTIQGKTIQGRKGFDDIALNTKHIERIDELMTKHHN
jgi:hypothetical protein